MSALLFSLLPLLTAHEIDLLKKSQATFLPQSRFFGFLIGSVSTPLAHGFLEMECKGSKLTWMEWNVFGEKALRGDTELLGSFLVSVGCALLLLG